jgi:hypothetical protein
MADANADVQPVSAEQTAGEKVEPTGDVIAEPTGEETATETTGGDITASVDDTPSTESSPSVKIMVGAIKAMPPTDLDAIKKELCDQKGGRRRSRRRAGKKSKKNSKKSSARKSKKGGRSRRNGSKRRAHRKH